jgi:hypothetical protein
MDGALRNIAIGRHNMMRILLAVVLLGVSNVSFGAFVSGHELQSFIIECKKYRADPESGDFARSCGLGQSYVMGVFDTADSLTERWLFQKHFCKPNDVDQEVLITTVRKYMDDHPEQMEFAAAGIVYDALTQAYPCD